MLGKLYSALHLELVERKADSIGVSFPQAHRKGIGGILRVHGTRDDLSAVSSAKRINQLSDYFDNADITSIPTDHRWCFVKRIQPKISAAKARRMVARGSISEEHAQRFYDSKAHLTGYPFIRIVSRSSGQHYRLYIDQAECEPPAMIQRFNTFGLGAAVPWF
jgi:CRISPR-associated endonuclease Csy4